MIDSTDEAKAKILRPKSRPQEPEPPGSVLRCPTAAENGVMTKGVVSVGGFDLCLRHIMSSPSQTLRRRLV